MSKSLARARRALHHNVGACGDSLRYLATTVDGYTLDNPYGRFAYFSDVTGWRARCREIFELAKEHFNYLGTLGESPWPEWEAKRPEYNTIVEKINELDDVGGKWTGSAVEEAIAFCTGLASRMVCFLEEVDAAIVKLGGTPPGLPAPVKPAPPPTSPAELGSIAVKLGAVAIVAYVVVNLAKS